MKNIWLILTFLLAWAFPKVHAENMVKILAIGNSFSEDAIEQNLHELADAEGIQTIVANLYIPGCSLERHMQCVKGDLKAYRYRKIGTDGKPFLWSLLHIPALSQRTDCLCETKSTQG